jgi:pimeloyl-ACP methyl ester carboxylesterase
MFGGPKEMEIQKRSFPGLLGMLLFLLFVVGLIAAASWWVARELTGFASIRDPWVAVKHALHTFHGWWKLGFRITVKQTWFAAWRMLSSVGSWVWRTKAWLVIVAIGFFLRYFIVEYVGDVAAYISPYKDSKFDEIRHTIQQIGLNVGKTIYGFGTATPNVPYYKQVVIVGHSLGSVLAYDTLNALLNLDNVLAPGDRRDVADRTRALITMGSPLDKTAFLFRMQARSNQNWIREAMAAAVQPLIVSYPDYRRKTFDWVNIWSPMDIISGELNYYDDPALRPNVAPCVQNHIDRQDRWWPIIAHVKYFGHKEFHKWLYTFVT